MEDAPNADFDEKNNAQILIDKNMVSEYLIALSNIIRYNANDDFGMKEPTKNFLRSFGGTTPYGHTFVVSLLLTTDKDLADRFREKIGEFTSNMKINGMKLEGVDQ